MPLIEGERDVSEGFAPDGTGWQRHDHENFPSM
jgi:hypothetical protein